MFNHNESGTDFPYLDHEPRSMEHTLRFISKSQEKNQPLVPMKNGAIARNSTKNRDLSR